MKSIAELKEPSTAGSADKVQRLDGTRKNTFAERQSYSGCNDNENDDEDEDEDEIADETRPLQHEQLNEPFVPLIFRLDIKVAENETRQLVIDRTIEDPWQKASVFCKMHELTDQQAQKLNRVISMNIPKNVNDAYLVNSNATNINNDNVNNSSAPPLH